MRRPATVLVATLAALGLACAAAAPASAAPLPVVWSLSRGSLPNALKPSTAPPGANNWACRSARHPIPVVLVHGTFEHQNDNWHAYAPYLTNLGFCVYTFNYGMQFGILGGFEHPADSAVELKHFVEQVVLPRTGARQVDLVGHSQGGMMPRYYIKFLGGGPRIHALVGISSSNHGSTVSGLGTLLVGLGLGPLAAHSPGLTDQVQGSPFMKLMDTCPGGLPPADICAGDPVRYTVIATTEDRVMTPYTNSFLKGARNITIQSICPLDNTGHTADPYDRNIAFQVVKALDPTVTGTVCVRTSALDGG